MQNWGTASVFDTFAPDATTWLVTPPPLREYGNNIWELALTCQRTDARLATEVPVWEDAALDEASAGEAEVRIRTATFSDYSSILEPLRTVCRSAVELDTPAWFYYC